MPRALCSVLPEGSVLGLELIFDALTPPVSEGCWLAPYEPMRKEWGFWKYTLSFGLLLCSLAGFTTHSYHTQPFSVMFCSCLVELNTCKWYLRSQEWRPSQMQQQNSKTNCNFLRRESLWKSIFSSLPWLRVATVHNNPPYSIETMAEHHDKVTYQETGSLICLRWEGSWPATGSSKTRRMSSGQ
jgi:hypothetical protein